MLRWLFLDMNAFFASVEQQENPSLRGKPVGVVPMLADSTRCIAASYEAKAFGVKTGTNVAEAKRLCPEIRLIVASHGPYREYHNRIVEAVGNCTPVDRVLSVDEMVCRLWANDRSATDAIALARRIKQRIARDAGECLRCSVGISLNPFLAKVASELEKPDGLVVLDEDEIPSKLTSLNLRDFPGINRRMEERFHSHGIFDTARMYAASIEEMRSVFGGVTGERWWRLLRGEEVVDPSNPRRTVSHSHVLPPELRTAAGARAVAARLLEKAAERMRHLGFHARSLGVRVGGPSGASWDAHVTFTASADTWTLMDALTGIWRPPYPAPRKVGVVLYNLVADIDAPRSLFDDQPRRARASAAVDRINRTFGRGTVTLACTLPAAHTADDKIAFAKVAEM
ncbi:MAG: DNA polymerase [Capsulimonadaceae bacterium]